MSDVFYPLYIDDAISATDVCTLLQISKPYLKKLREKFKIREYKIKRKIFFSKTEILQVIYTQIVPQTGTLNFHVLLPNNFDSLKVSDNVYDLRKIDQIDGHGAISLICHLMTEIRKENKHIHLICDKTNLFLKSMNFFSALKQLYNSKIFWDEKTVNSIDVRNYEMIKLPITRLGVVGAHNTITDDLIISLEKQGYSRDICSYIGWAIGELTDNSTTHAKIYPCFVYFERYGENKKYLQFTIGDIGVGIPTSLKSNPRYSTLSDATALLTAFKPNVSGRSDEEKRGKGLTDVLKIAMECGSTLKVESNNIGYSLTFNTGKDNFSSHIPLFKSEGTIISLLFIDGNFASLERSNVDKYIDTCLEKI